MKLDVDRAILRAGRRLLARPENARGPWVLTNEDIKRHLQHETSQKVACHDHPRFRACRPQRRP